MEHEKFRDFFFSALAVQRLSDLICLEHQLSVIEIKPYRERQKRTLYPPRESNRDRLCSVIDNILAEKPKDYEELLQKLEQQGYEVKRGKYTSVKGARQKRFIRFRTLGVGYSEEELKAVLAGEVEHRPRQKCPAPEQKFQMLVDIQAKLVEGKGTGFARWAKQHNLKEMSRTLIFLQENKIGSIEEMQERVDAATARYHELGDSIKASEKRLTEIAVLKAHIINYAKTRPVYDAYRKTGYSKRFLETHRTEITLHKAAKAAFDEANLKTLPKVKELDAEYSKRLTENESALPGTIAKRKKKCRSFFVQRKCRMVTPSSQIVGTQAVFNVLMGERYKMVTKETKAVLSGEYGKTVKPFNKEVQKKCIGDKEPITCRPADLIPDELDTLRGEMAQWSEQDEDVLSYALFPQVATDFFKYREAQQTKVDATVADSKNGAYPV